MSQTETILLIVLGFSLAALIALFIGRFVWTLGLRLGARRMQKQVPSTVSTLQTERDRLRADYAMLFQRHSSKIEAIKLRLAEQMAEVTRHRNRIEALKEGVAARDTAIAARDAEIATLKDLVATLEPRAAAAEEAVTALQGELAAREAEVAIKDAEVSGLKMAASSSGSPAYHAEPVQLVPVMSPEERLKVRIDELANMSRTMATETAPPGNPVLRDGLADASRETADIQQELERLDAEWNKRLSELDQVEMSERTTSVANVISLANRIRALKKDIAK